MSTFLNKMIDFNYVIILLPSMIIISKENHLIILSCRGVPRGLREAGISIFIYISIFQRVV